MSIPSNVPEGAGRPPHIVKNPEKQDIVIEGLKNTLTYGDAANKAGMSRSALQRTLRRGRKARRIRETEGEEELGFWEPYYISFLERVEAAESEIKENLLSEIRDDGSWQSNAWILERRYGWTKEDRVVHEGQVQQDHQFTLDIGEPAHQQDEDEQIEEADYEILESGE